MNGHHLILGKLTDYVSGQTLDDTLDERYRQQIGRLLVDQKGYPKTCITPRREIEVRVDQKCARLWITYVINSGRQIAMIIQYGPGSLVTRHRPALAMGRLVAPYQVPVVVVTNGEAADILNGQSGSILFTGLDNIPNHSRLQRMVKALSWPAVSSRQAEMEARILMAFEVDDRCPCDDTVCTLGPENPQ